jgi:hypothetical protein
MADEGTWETKSKPPRELKVALQFLAEGDDEDALLELKEVVVPGDRATRRRLPSREVQIARLYEDGFSCGHCGKALIPVPVLRAITLFWPDEIPVQANWAGTTHPLYLQFAATFDRANPRAIGGMDRLENLLTSCWACNASQGPFLLEHDESRRSEPRHPKWRGLVPQYLELEARVRDRSTDQWNRLHRLWMRDLKDAELRRDGPMVPCETPPDVALAVVGTH